MPKTCPFTRKTLLKYPGFTALPTDLQSRALDLFDEGRLNETGNFKRAPNPFFTYRRERSVQIMNEHKATHGSSPLKHLSQKDISLRTQNEWSELPADAKKVYQLKAKAGDEELRKEFRYYEYTPICESWWNVLNKDGKRRFFFETMLQICKVQVHNSPWPGYLVIKKWAQLPENAGFVDPEKQVEFRVEQPRAAPRHAARGSGSQSTPQSAPARPHQEVSHPYNAPRMSNEPKQGAASWLDQLKSRLVHLGPRAPDGPERMLELLLLPPQGTPIPVYIEVEIPLGIPQDVIDSRKTSSTVERSIPNNALILWGYTKPQHTSNLPPPAELAPPVLPNLSISQEPRVTCSPSMYSPASSSSVTGNNHLPLTPVQAALANNAHRASPSNWHSGNSHAQGTNTCTTVPAIASSSYLSPHTMQQNTEPTGIPSAGYNAYVTLENSHYSTPYGANPAGTDIDAQYPRLSAIPSTQSDPSLNSDFMLPLDPNDQLSEEELRIAMDHLDQAFQKLRALSTLQY
ncbi:hypothetical protein RSAG8_07305, partial [Rhizoctonia solani AG-8 WAC10335]